MTCAKKSQYCKIGYKSNPILRRNIIILTKKIQYKHFVLIHNSSRCRANLRKKLNQTKIPILVLNFVWVINHPRCPNWGEIHTGIRKWSKMVMWLPIWPARQVNWIYVGISTGKILRATWLFYPLLFGGMVKVIGDSKEILFLETTLSISINIWNFFGLEISLSLRLKSATNF